MFVYIREMTNLNKRKKSKNRRTIWTFLPRNQFGQAIISFTALLVSISAIVITSNTNKIMEQQIEVTKAEKRPLINFKRDYENDEAGFAIREKISIHNEGGLMEEFDSEVFTFFDISILDYGKNEIEQHIIVPIRHYYYGFTTGALQKEVVTYSNPFFKEGNNKKIFNVAREFAELKKPLEQKQIANSDYQFLIGEADFKTYFKVVYKDIYGEKQEIYYDASNLGAKKISVTQGEKIFENDELLSKGFDIEDLTASKLLEYVEKEMNR